MEGCNNGSGVVRGPLHRKERAAAAAPQFNRVAQLCMPTAEAARGVSFYVVDMYYSCLSPPVR